MRSWSRWVLLLALACGERTSNVSDKSAQGFAKPTSDTLPTQIARKKSPALTSDILREFEQDLQKALAAGPAELAKLAHARGIRFSPDAHFENSDVTLSAAQLASPASEKLAWGKDSSGRDVELSVDDFVSSYIVKRFQAYQQNGSVYQGRQSLVGHAGNIAATFPDSVTYEFHFPGREASAFLDWSSVLVVVNVSSEIPQVVAIAGDSAED